MKSLIKPLFYLVAAVVPMLGANSSMAGPLGLCAAQTDLVTVAIDGAGEHTVCIEYTDSGGDGFTLGFSGTPTTTGPLSQLAITQDQLTQFEFQVLDFDPPTPVVIFDAAASSVSAPPIFLNEPLPLLPPLPPPTPFDGLTLNWFVDGNGGELTAFNLVQVLLPPLPLPLPPQPVPVGNTNVDFFPGQFFPDGSSSNGSMLVDTCSGLLLPPDPFSQLPPPPPPCSPTGFSPDAQFVFINSIPPIALDNTLGEAPAPATLGLLVLGLLVIRSRKPVSKAG